MDITKFTTYDEKKVPASFRKRLGWFLGLWVAGTVTIILVASLFHMLIPH
ncbi:hypothetical protein NQF87_05490 [Bombella sp. TMW 2.2559]|uniref:DUF2474 domain-containing protein n=1 Tax=Bombella dulcis TaxID=2967339 RepID=A0ABT3WBV4_9PROT|nr:hypothetical protein [Bombella dulcis]MCX5616426.1 hypothetical protein [Bombella dulcis]